MKLKKPAFTLLKIAFVAAIIFLLIKNDRLDFSKLALLAGNINELILLLSLFIAIVIPLAAFRWWLLLRGLGYRMPFSRIILLTWIGNFFNTTLPGAITGDVIKGFYVYKANKDAGKTNVFTSLLVDRLSGFFGMSLMAALALLFNWQKIIAHAGMNSLAKFILCIVAATIIFYTLIILPFEEGNDPFLKVIHRVPLVKNFHKIYTTFKMYQFHKRNLFGALAISIVIHCFVAYLFLTISHLTGAMNLTFPTQMLIMPFGLITAAIPIAPGGIGVGHVAFDRLYDFIGINGGADIFNIFVVIQLTVYLIGGFFYFLYNNEYKIPDQDPFFNKNNGDAV